MKKTKLLALTLVVAIMMMGAGYAYWSESLVVENVVETGDLSVVFTEKMFKPRDTSYLILNPDNIIFAKDGKIDPEAKVQNLRFELSNLHPGAKFVTFGQMQNVGSIGALFDNAVVEFEDRASLADFKEHIIVKLVPTKYNENGDPIGSLPVTTCKLGDLEETLRELFKGQVLEPGDYFGTTLDEVTGIAEYMQYELDPTLEGNALENKSVAFDVTITWTQYNNPNPTVK